MSRSSSVGASERPAPPANCLVGHNDAALGERGFDIPETQAERKVEPDGVRNGPMISVGMDIRRSSTRDCSFRYSDTVDVNPTTAALGPDEA